MRPPRRAIRTRSGRKTTALQRRSVNEGSFAGARSGTSAASAGTAAFTAAPGSARSAKSTASSLEVIDRLVEVLSPEVGPQRIRDPELGVCELPEQEIRDAQLSARPDQEIG